MTSYFKKVLEWKLKILAGIVVRKYHPKIVGVTGSVGKTSTKDAIATVLRAGFRVRKNMKNYNNEIGVPLAILGEESGGKNLFIWLGVFFRALRLICFRDANYPEVLVLEMGADKTGDIEYLTSFAPCTVGVVTAVSEVHLEYFKTLDRVITEKRKMVSQLFKEGFAVLNADDPSVLAMREKTRATVITYGFAETADVRSLEATVSEGPINPDQAPTGVSGISYKMSYRGSTVPVFLPSVLGSHQVLAGLAAAAVGISFGLNLHEIAGALKNFVSPPGRMNLLPGIKYTRIIDDSYNSSPRAAKAALDTLKALDVRGRRIAALGEMAELGDATVREHEDVGRYAAKSGLDLLVVVGEKAKIIAQAAVEAGFAESNISMFPNAEEAGRYIQRELKEGDVVLVKGSQVARMEKITKELMAEPLRASELLVRQGLEWR